MAQIVTDKIKKEKMNDMEIQRQKDREMVRGILRFHEVPGGSLSFVYRKYKQDPIERYDMIDGETYTIPLGVAKHLNKEGWYPVHAYTIDEAGKSSRKVGQKIRRFSFQSLEFIDEIDPVKSLITVENF